MTRRGWWGRSELLDADTKAAAQTALGRPLATFDAPDEDPSINDYADANLLRARLKAYVDAIRTYVLASYPAAQFELLCRMDVNDPDACQLMRYINLPAEWQPLAATGFDTFMSEGFQCGGINHNLDHAKRCGVSLLSWDQVQSAWHSIDDRA